MRKTKFASFCSHREKLALWNDPVALSPISVWAVSQNSGTDILFPLEVVDEEIRYFSDVLLFFCRECTKPYFPSPIVFNQQEARLFGSKLQNVFQLGPFLKTVSYPFPYACFANVALAGCSLSRWLFNPRICMALSASCWTQRMHSLLPQQQSIPGGSTQPFLLGVVLPPAKYAKRVAHISLPYFMLAILA